MEKLDLDQFSNIKINKIKVDVKIGSERNKSIQEAIILSITYMKIIEIEFNDKTYLINPLEIVDTVKELIKLKTE